MRKKLGSKTFFGHMFPKTRPKVPVNKFWPVLYPARGSSRDHSVLQESFRRLLNGLWWDSGGNKVFKKCDRGHQVSEELNLTALLTSHIQLQSGCMIISPWRHVYSYVINLLPSGKNRVFNGLVIPNQNYTLQNYTIQSLYFQKRSALLSYFSCNRHFNFIIFNRKEEMTSLAPPNIKGTAKT